MNEKELIEKYQTPSYEMNNYLKSLYSYSTAIAPNHDSAIRINMGINQAAASLYPENPTTKMLLSDWDFDIYDNVMKTEAEEDCVVLGVVNRNVGGVNIETVVLVYIPLTNTIDVIHLTGYVKNDTKFGFENKFPNNGLLQKDVYIQKGTAFAIPKPMDEKIKVVQCGTDIDLTTLTITGVSEDAVVVSQSTVEKLKFPIWETYIIELNELSVPLKIGTFSNGKNKYFPEVGEKHGLYIFAQREYTSVERAFDFTYNDISVIEKEFDNIVSGFQSGGTVVDIKVIKNKKASKSVIINSDIDQIERHAGYYTTYLENLVSNYNSAIKKYPQANVSYKLCNMIVEAKVCLSGEMDINYKKSDPFRYRIEIVVKYVVKPNLGYKVTTSEGCKGVISEIRPDNQMPNGAGMIISTEAVTNRMIIGSKIESYISSAGKKTVSDIRKIVGSRKLNELTTYDISLIEEKFSILYQNTIMNDMWKSHYVGDRSMVLDHLNEVLKYGIKLDVSLRVEDHLKPVNFIKNMEINNPPEYDNITFENYGNITTTHGKVRVSPIAVYLLDKITTDWLASNSKVSRHILGPLVHGKNSSIHIDQIKSTRVSGEAEVRIKVNTCPPELIAEMYDISNNPEVLKEVSKRLLMSDTPSNIDYHVDREIFKFGKALPLVVIYHFFRCFGMEIAYK